MLPSVLCSVAATASTSLASGSGVEKKRSSSVAMNARLAGRSVMMRTTSSPSQLPVRLCTVFSPASWYCSLNTNLWWWLPQPVNARAISRMSCSL